MGGRSSVVHSSKVTGIVQCSSKTLVFINGLTVILRTNNSLDRFSPVVLLVDNAYQDIYWSRVL